MGALFTSIRSTAGFAVAGVLFLIAFVFLLQMFRIWIAAMQSRTWSATRGRVLSSTLQRTRRIGTSGGGSYVPLIVYQYSVNGQLYTSSRYSFGNRIGTGFSGIAQRALEDYPVGQEVDVYYNPANPTQAVLKRSAGGSWGNLLIVAVLVIAALIVLVSFAGVQLPF